ncbi:hypothetical protein [Glycomyces paridis]|uniref:Uncharacterized protein n=1 Tax=Glycomyces paridis TaxID=2126555 RepID=A0A4S8P6T6_9ACTN|nr:hypothetical protein [Glycomyces paridis]THV25987.1 hypothetical protein E9998_19835 [Glycomyces paridis]
MDCTCQCNHTDDRIAQWKRRADQLQKQLSTVEGIVADMFDSGKCWFDHNGHCQEHGWFDTEPACPHGRARALGLGEGDGQ